MKELKQLEELFSKGKITRRQFLARTAALGLTATVSPLLLGTPARASIPKKGGRLRAGIPGGAVSESIDPAQIIGGFSILLSTQLRNTLVEIDSDNNTIPELAESWEASPDAKKWVFKLRKGVEFHNGKTMDAEDVVFSINHHRKEDSKSGAKALVKPITDVKADGKHTVIFELEGGNVDFPYFVGEYILQIVPVNTTNFEKGIGTGGYMLVEHEPGVRSLTKRNPNYWKEGRAHFDEVEMIHIADDNARSVALKTGQVDLIQRVDMKTFDMLKKMPGIQGIETDGFMHYEYSMRADIPPFDNNDARLAMKYAFDRELVLKQFLRGHGVIANDHPVSRRHRFFNTELEQRTFDPDKAKYHLKKAGMEGKTFKLHVSNAGFTGAPDAAILYKERAAKAGVNIKVVKVPDDGYWTETWGVKPFAPTYWNGRPTEDQVFTVGWAKGAGWNNTNWAHERFNKILKEARAVFDTEKRREMYWELQQIARDEGTRLVFAFVPYLDAASDKVKFGKIAPNHMLDGTYFTERWWFES